MHKVFFPVSKSQPCKVKRYLEIFLLSSSVFCLDICFKQLNFGGTNWWNSNPWNISISTIHDFQCYESVSKRLHTYAPTSIAHFYCLKLKYIFLDRLREVRRSSLSSELHHVLCQCLRRPSSDRSRSFPPGSSLLLCWADRHSES